ncbi:hypothetical protein C8R43DRAFT_966012 [Mycena crocata]|nr:hypothetical protein C8R43DRAFT_966012 [Mycena crocata]
MSAANQQGVAFILDASKAANRKSLRVYAIRCGAFTGRRVVSKASGDCYQFHIVVRFDAILQELSFHKGIDLALQSSVARHLDLVFEPVYSFGRLKEHGGTESASYQSTSLSKEHRQHRSPIETQETPYEVVLRRLKTRSQNVIHVKRQTSGHRLGAEKSGSGENGTRAPAKFKPRVRRERDPKQPERKRDENREMGGWERAYENENDDEDAFENEVVVAGAKTNAL